MNLSDFRTSLQDLYGNTLSSEDDYYDRVVNAAYHKICAETDWWWLEGSEIITVDVPSTTYAGLTITNGSTSVTEGTAFSLLYGAGAHVATGSRVYELSSLTISALTLTSSVLEDTSTAASLTIWESDYALASDCEHVLQVIPRGNPNHLPLREVDREDIESFGPDLSDHAADFADRFAVSQDLSNTTGFGMLLTLFPPGQVVQDYTVRYRKRPADMSSDSDIPALPTKYHNTLLDYSKLELLKNEGEDADRIGAFEMEAAKGMRQLLREQRRRGHIQRRFGRRGPAAASKSPYKLVNTSGSAW